MMSFAIDMVSATEVYPEGPEKCTLVTSNLVPKSTAELPDFKEIFAQYMANGDVVRNEDVIDLVKVCARHDAPIVPFGVGSSLEGHVNATHGGV